MTYHWIPLVVEKSPHFWDLKGRMWAEAAAHRRGPPDSHMLGQNHSDRLKGSSNSEGVCVWHMCKCVHILLKAEDTVYSWVLSCLPIISGAKSNSWSPGESASTHFHSSLFSFFPMPKASSLPLGPLPLSKSSRSRSAHAGTLPGASLVA